LVARLGSEADAEDVLQIGLMKAMRADADGTDDLQSLTAWFYRVLKNAMVDHARNRSASIRRDHAWATNSADVDPEISRNVCACLHSLVDRLPKREAELIRRVELQDERVADAALALCITPNNASVTLHRARANLKRLLMEFCGDCAAGACLDCDCDNAAPGSESRVP
jgi:RNA polymerase sigma-70 factor (ECF subfamily)